MTVENLPAALEGTPNYVRDYLVPELSKLLLENPGENCRGLEYLHAPIEKVEWSSISCGVPRSEEEIENAREAGVKSRSSVSFGETYRVKFKAVGVVFFPLKDGGNKELQSLDCLLDGIFLYSSGNNFKGCVVWDYSTRLTQRPQA